MLRGACGTRAVAAAATAARLVARGPSAVVVPAAPTVADVADQSVIGPAGVAADVERWGFAVIPDFASPAQVAALRAAAGDVVSDFLESRQQRSTAAGANADQEDGSSADSIFTTAEQDRHSDATFLASAASVQCFFEEDAVRPEEERAEHGLLRDGVDPMESINKAGHALHERVPAFRDFVHGSGGRSEELRALAAALMQLPRQHAGGPGLAVPAPAETAPVRVVQDMYIFKQPRVGGAVTTHQDSSFLLTQPQLTCFGFWFALEDTDETNSCLWVVPGSHKAGLANRFVLSDPDHPASSPTQFVQPPEAFRAPWESLTAEFGESARHRSAATAKQGREWVPVPVKSGSLVLIHGSVVHASEPNTSGRSRHAYTFHVTSGNQEWQRDNWLQRPADKPFVAL